MDHNETGSEFTQRQKYESLERKIDTLGNGYSGRAMAEWTFINTIFW